MRFIKITIYSEQHEECYMITIGYKEKAKTVQIRSLKWVCYTLGNCLTLHNLCEEFQESLKATTSTRILTVSSISVLNKANGRQG